MDENTSLWNKQASELTVADTIKVAIITPVIVTGVMIGTGMVFSAVKSLTRKIRKSETSTEEVPQVEETE